MSRQETSNTFSDGLIKDLNPINTPDTALTDCVNGTIITYDGNEYSLQNDRGNYALKNCVLPKGYVPVGTAEHGGIIYIVSYNPIENKTEIGSYPSTRVVTNPLSNTASVDSGQATTGNYSELAANCKLGIFSGAKPEEYKIYPGDRYKLTGKIATTTASDEFFVIDENKALHDITNEIVVDEWKNVSWGVPGWIAVKKHIANIDTFGVGVRSISVPTYLREDSKMKIQFRFRIVATDPLITKAPSNLSVTYNITNEVDPPKEGRLTWSVNGGKYSLGNGGEAYYFDTEELEFSVNENTVITVNAMPHFAGINYDQCNTVFTYRVNASKMLDDFGIGHEVWKYKTFDDHILIDFSTEGLEGYKDISDLELKYSIYSLNGTELISKKSVADWQFAGMYTMLEIPFTDSFVGEDIYVIHFEIFASESETPIFSNAKLLVATKLLNDKYKEGVDFDTLSFKDWITEYGKYVTNTNIKIEENEVGTATPVGVPSDLNQFTPIQSTSGPYGDWRSGQESKNFNTLLTKSAFKKVTSAKEITLESSYRYTKSFKLSTDAKLLSGPLWRDAIQNSKVNIWCNDQKINLNVNSDGTIAPTNSNISGSCAIKSIYRPEPLTDDGITVWSYDADEKLTSTEGYIECDITKINRNGYNPVSVRVSSSSSRGSEIIGSNLALTLTALPPLANQLKSHDAMFLKSITACSATSNSIGTYGASLNYENIYANPNKVNSSDDRDKKYIYFMALPASISYDKMQVIQIGDASITEDNARNIFKNTLRNFTKLTCYDDVISGGFVKLSKSDTKTNSSTDVSCDGSIVLESVKYLNLNLLEDSGRNSLINSIQSKFQSWNINCNLLKSTENLEELTSIILDPIKKNFEIKNQALQSKLEDSLRESDLLIDKRNQLIENQWILASDPIYSIYSPNQTTFSKKDDVNSDYNTNIILDLLNKKQPTTNTKAIYKTSYWHGSQDRVNTRYAFAYCDPQSHLNVNS